MKSQTVVSLDPIDRRNKKRSGPVGRLFKTRHYRGKGITKTDAFGHYLFVGKQRSGKTVSAIWFYELLKKQYEKRGKKVILYSNMGFGNPVFKLNLPAIIRELKFNKDVVYIFIIDELQSYFPKDTKDTSTLRLIDELTGEFSQLGKRQIYVLSTAQIYGRVNKNLREQCLFMVNCRKSKLTNHVVNDFIDGDDILCDDLGRWSGEPVKIMVHGLPKTSFDTHRMITV